MTTRTIVVYLASMAMFTLTLVAVVMTLRLREGSRRLAGQITRREAARMVICVLRWTDQDQKIHQLTPGDRVQLRGHLVNALYVLHASRLPGETLPRYHVPSGRTHDQTHR